MHRGKNKSSDRSRDTINLSQYASIHNDRKSHTPSVLNNPKRKSKSKQKSTDKKGNHQSIKAMKPQHDPSSVAYHAPVSKKAANSPFKHKARPISNLAGARHAKNIDHQLSHLNESVFRNESSCMEESSKKSRGDPHTSRLMDEARKHMKNNSFEQAIALFQETLSKDEDNVEALYLLGVSTFHLEDYENCIKCLSNVLMRDDHYRKNVYLFLGIAYKKTGFIQESILTLTRAIAFYPKYYDALILRAKILSKQRRFYDAVQDLNKCIKLEPQNLQAYISKADCLRSLAQYKECIILYSEVLEAKMDMQILLKRSIAYIQFEQVDEAIQDLNLIISKNPTNSEAYLFKGLAYTKVHEYNDAILSYEQAIKFNTSRKATTKALYEITKLKIEMGDYYGASYTLERAGSLDVDAKVLEKMKIFAEGSTSIMKKKFKRGIENLSILSRKENLSDQLRPLIYSFRSYGYFSQHKFSNAINDLNTLMKLGFQLDRACQYNYTVLEGIIACQNNQFEEAQKSFSNAQTSRPEFSDPLIYKGLTKVAEYNRNPKSKNPLLLQEALNFIGEALEREGASSTHYLAACVLYEMGQLPEALDNVEKAIEKSENHTMKHMYLRGLIKAHLGEYKEAYLQFFNVQGVMNELKEREKEPVDPDEPDREKEIPEIYLNRAKCYLLFGEKKKAFQDLQTYIAKKPLDGEVHAVAGRLLFSIGSFQDAIKAYNYSPNIDKHREILFERMKCYLLLKELNYCLKDMEKILELGFGQIKYDYCCLDSLKEASKGYEQNYQEALGKIEKAELMSYDGGVIFKQSDLFFYKGLYKFYLGDYAEALKLFSKSKNLKALNNQLQILSINEEGNVDEQQLENRIYTDKEIEYNIAITQMMMGKDASQVLRKYDGFSDYFEGSLERGGDPIEATPFPTSNRLCSIFPEKIHDGKIKFKLSFCLPEVVPPEIKFDVDHRILRDLNMGSTEPRPDAPWIKRNVYGVVFTDEIMGVDVDLRTEKSFNNLDAIKIETENYEEAEDSNEREKVKNRLVIDQNLEQKLERLMKKKK